MTPIETVALCRYVKACCPQQAIDEYTPDAWFDLIGGLDFEDAKTAVRRVAGRQPFAAPAEIAAEVKRIRAERVQAYGELPLPPAWIRGIEDGPQFNAAYQRWLGETKDAIASGREPDGDRLPEIEAPVDAAETLEHIRREIERRRIEDTSDTEPDDEDPTPDERPAA